MLVEFNQVSLQFNNSHTVLDGVNLSLPQSSFHFLTGPSGAGKSTLLKLIYLSQKADSGNIRLFDRDVSYLDPDEKPLIRRRIGVVFQDFRLIPHLTALENASLPLRLVGAGVRQIKDHVAELLAWVGLSDKLNAYPAELSGGEQQRVAIARAVVNKPTLLLADEPTGNVDEASAEKLLHLFLELNKMGTAVLLATHQKDLVRKIGKPAITIKDAKITMPRLRKGEAA